MEKCFEAGVTRIYVHSTSPDEIKFIQMFSKRVMPHFSNELHRIETATSA
jgi:coenzyme F420-dependent glucose-6-phosphate dehydrogenase